MKEREQFDKRYVIKPCPSENAGLRRKTAFIVEQQKARLTGQTRRPSNIAWFEQQLDDMGASSGKPLIGCFCNMVPLEPIYAMGAVPLRLCCGNAALVQAGEEVLHGEICPVVKSSFASFLDPRSPSSRCTALVVPATCDPKRKLGEALSDFKPAFMLNLPPEQDFGRYAGMMTSEIERMVRFLGKQLGTGLRRTRLLAAVKTGQRRSEIARRLQVLRGEKPDAMSARDAMIIMQAHGAAADPERWNEEASEAIREMESHRPERKRLRPRIILTGAPLLWPNFKLLNLIEESGADVVADTLCSGVQGAFDAVSFDETGKTALLRALASRYVFGSVCPCFISQGTRLSRVLELAAEFKADGVINHGLRLCQLFDMESHRLAGTLKARKIPFANIRTDYSLEDSEQLRVRIEAFLETLGE